MSAVSTFYNPVPIRVGAVLWVRLVIEMIAICMLHEETLVIETRETAHHRAATVRQVHRDDWSRTAQHRTAAVGH